MKLFTSGHTLSASRKLAARMAATSIACLLALAGCGGGGDDDDDGPPPPPPTVQISGTAATGAAVGNATVTATNSAGQTATATTAANGNYEITIEAGAPYLLKVTTAGGDVLYSFANAAGAANLTPLTTLALHDANGRRPLAGLFTGWGTTRLAADAVAEAARRVNANLRAAFATREIDANTYDFFTRSFTADGSGIDGVLDSIDFSLTCSSTTCTETIIVGDSTITYDFSISTAGISFTSGGGSSSTIPGGSVWDLTLSGTVNGAPINQTIHNVQFGAVPSSAAGTQDILQQYGGLSGSGSVNVPGTSISYSFSGLSSSYEGCGACGVNSTIVVRASGSVTVSGTANGITIPPTTSNFNYTYTYKRVS